MPTWFRVVLVIVGVLIAALALIVNISFYSTYGTDDTTKGIFIALACVSLAVKLLAPAAAAYKPPKFAAFCLWLGFVAAVAFDSLGTAGYVEMTYGSKTGEASRYAATYEAARKEVSKLEAALNEYAATRSTGEIETELKGAENAAGKCTAKRAHLDSCKRVSELKTEQARAAERDKRENEWREAKAKFDNMKKPQITADPQAAVFERIGSRIGADDLKSFVALFISVLIFIFFEVAGPALVFVGLHSQGITNSTPSRDRGRRPEASAPAPPRASRSPRTDGAILDTLRALIAAGGAEGVTVRGSTIEGGQRALGAACGMSGAKMNHHLRGLSVAGKIALRTGPKGTVIDVL